MIPRLRAMVRRGPAASQLQMDGWVLDPKTLPIDEYVTLLWCRADDPPWRPIGTRVAGVRE